MKNKRRIKPKKICMKTIFWIVVVCIMFVNLVPLLWMLSASFKTIVDIMNPKKMFVFTPTAFPLIVPPRMVSLAGAS